MIFDELCVSLYLCFAYIMYANAQPSHLLGEIGILAQLCPSEESACSELLAGGDHAHHTQTVLFLIFLRYAKMPSYDTLLTTHPLIPSQAILTAWFTFSFTLQHLTYLTRCLFILTEIEALHSEFKLPAVGTPVSVIRCYRSSAYSGAWHGLGGQQVVLNE